MFKFTVKLLLVCVVFCISCNGLRVGHNDQRKIGISSLSGKRDAGLVVTYNGGGFRAHAVHSGVMAGVLGATGRSMDELFTQVSSVGSNSGGSWFFAQMAYSQNFEKMLEDIGNSRDEAEGGAIYNEAWIRKWTDGVYGRLPRNSTTISNSDIFDSLKGVVYFVNFVCKSIPICRNNINFPKEELLKLLTFAQRMWGQTEVSWDRIVEHILAIPGDLDPKQSLASAKPNTFAKGISWGIAGGVITPLRGLFPTLLASQSDHSTNRTRMLSYNTTLVSGKQGDSMYSPITFSVRMGSKGKSPMSFLGTPDGASDIRTDYYFDGGRVTQDLQKTRFFQGESNLVSLGQSVGTSSAFLGSLGLFLYPLSYFDMARRYLDHALLRVALHASTTKSPSEAFANGKELLSKEQKTDAWANQVAQSGVMSFIDGGYIDNTALANVLQTGASKALLFVNGENWGMDDILALFTTKTSFDPQSGIYLQIPIFKEQQDYAQKQINSFKNARISLNQPKYLQGIRYGTIKATTRIEPRWNMKQSRSVEINIVFTSSNLFMGEVEWPKYGILVGEIAQAIKNDHDLVKFITNNLST